VIFLSLKARSSATAKVCPEIGNNGGLTLWSHSLSDQGAEPSLPGRSGRQRSLQLIGIVGQLPSLLSMEKNLH